LFSADDKIDALKDYNKAIELSPTDQFALIGRAKYYSDAGEFEKAVADLDRAVAASPDSVIARSSRAYAEYNVGSWQKSLSDFREASKQDAQDDYLRLRVWLIRARIGERTAATEELRLYLKSATKTDSNPWALNLVKFLAGDITEEDLFKAIVLGDADKVSERRCEAYFYAGSVRLINGDRKTAVEYFQKTLSTNIRTFTEYRSAIAELKRLGIK
jgi:lipoprotein NlpI